MSYAALIWSQRENIHTRRILTLQKQVLRIISFSDFQAPSSPLFLRFKTLPFFDFVESINIIFIFNILNNKIPSALTDTLKVERCYQHGRGHLSHTKSGLLKLPNVSSVLFGNNSFRYQSILSWNLLQNYLAINDMSTLVLGLKYLIKFYFLSSINK